MQIDRKLDVQLVRAIREGVSALPGDLTRLRSYVLMIEHLLQEKAADLEPSWEAACNAAAEIETLHRLEDTVAERAIAVEASTLHAVRSKLAIWKILSGRDEGTDEMRDRLILSIDADLSRLATSPSV